MARYWSINTVATAVPLSAHPSPLVIITKLAAAILGGPLFGDVLPAQYCPCGLTNSPEPRAVRAAMLREVGRRDAAWSPGEHDAAVEKIRVLTCQLLQPTDSLRRVVVATATTAQQPQKRVLEFAVEHRVDERAPCTDLLNTV